MPNDVITINTLANELNTIICGARISKIYQPEKDALSFTMRNNFNNFSLLISASSTLPRVHISTIKKDNPISAPSLCMVLRKYLSQGRIEKVILSNLDRIIKISITANNELMDIISYNLYVELMGSRSNLIFTNSEDKILGALKTTTLDSCNRQVIVGLKYTPPDRNEKTNILDIDKIYLEHSQSNLSTYEYLTRCTVGLSRQSIAEILWIIEHDFENISDSNKLVKAIKKMLVYPQNPVVLLDNNFATDYFIYPYSSITDNFKSYATLSNCIEICYEEKDNFERLRTKAKAIRTIIKNAITRTEKKIIANNDKAQECIKADECKIYGDLITSNLHRIEKGADSVVLENFYENMLPVKIILDTRLSPQKNGQKYYKLYTKLKRTEKMVRKMILENQDILQYYLLINDNLDKSKDERDLEDIRVELINCGLIIQKVQIKKQNHPSSPLKYDINGTIIYVGKNNVQNEELTFNVGAPLNIWLHAKDYHGSHVVIKANNACINENVLIVAAELAAFYSTATNSDKVNVDYTFIKNVKRKRNGQLGMVNYTAQTTLFVSPNNHTELLTNQ